MRSKQMQLHGWGRTSQARVSAYRPERTASVTAGLDGVPDRGVIAYAGGRSYGDAALNDGGRALLTGRLDRVFAFDAEAAEVVCEPGLTFNDLQSVLLPLGFTAPVIPGTGFATVGGGVANDVHGKNHDRHGSLGDHVRWLDLVLADGTACRVSPDDRPDLFGATIGGLGLTGIITAISLKLLPIPGDSVEVREYRATDLDGFLQLLAEHRDRATYSVGWVDALARGRRLGRGILQTAEPRVSRQSLAARRHHGARFAMPFDLPSWGLNRATVAAFNAVYYRRVPRGGRTRTMPFYRFLHPLDSILDERHMFGRRGFHQFQCVIPDADGEHGVRRLLEVVSDAGAASFLAVLKTLGGSGRGFLSFPMRGLTLALDLPAKSGAVELLRQLETVTLDHGGRVYLAKDSALSPEGFRKMYPELPAFRAVLDEVDPEGRFASDMARRLRIREGAP